jgi:hypothetical protein
VLKDDSRHLKSTPFLKLKSNFLNVEDSIMRHNKTFKEGTEFEDVVLWLQDVVKFHEEVIPGTHNLDHPDTKYVLSEGFNISIMKTADKIKVLGNG